MLFHLAEYLKQYTVLQIPLSNHAAPPSTLLVKKLTHYLLKSERTTHQGKNANEFTLEIE